MGGGLLGLYFLLLLENYYFSIDYYDFNLARNFR